MPSPKVTLKGAHRVVNVRVTQPIIDLAQQSDSSHCMIADAIRVAIPHVKSVSVDLATIRFTDPTKRQRYVYLTPPAAQQALIRFDQGVEAAEFTFRLVKAVQVVESAKRQVQADGTTKQPSRKVQKVVGTSGRKQPTILGGKLPDRAALSSPPTKAKLTLQVASPKAAGSAKATGVKRIAATAKTGRPNITLTANGTGRVRRFGLRQLKP
jgi:hypothetical protein